MKVTNFAKICETCLPTGWVLWAGGSSAQYNIEKTVADTFAMMIPRWPAQWRESCGEDVTVDFRLFKYIGIKSTGEYQQHLPYNGLELYDSMITTVNEFLTNMNATQFVQVQEVKPYDFLDTQGGATVNAQAQLMFTVKFKVWKEFDSILSE